MIYLDNASTNGYRDIDNLVVETITNAMKDYWQNPSSLYAVNVKEEIDNSRGNIAKFIGAKPEEIYFTSGASESNNWAIRGWVDEELSDGYKRVSIITTPIEHKSILEVLRNKKLDASIRYLEVDKSGLIDFESLNVMLWLCEGNPMLVSVNMANNEIGTLQNIKKISNLVHEHNGILHVDATQVLGHIPIDVKKLGIDMLSASGHKISSVLKGVGILYKKNHINIQPLIYGSQEGGLRGGTENVFGIIGLNKAIECCDVSREKVDELCEKRDYFINLLESKFGCKLNGSYEYRLPNNINVTFPHNITGEALLYTLDLAGIKISTGSACDSHSIEPSHVLKAIGLSDEESMKTIRLTLSENITYEDINYVVNEIEKAIKIIETQEMHDVI